GRTLPPFALWVPPREDAATHELGASPGTVVRLDPGVRVGLGYDGGLATWNAGIEPRSGWPVAATDGAPLASSAGSARLGHRRRPRRPRPRCAWDASPPTPRPP